MRGMTIAKNLPRIRKAKGLSQKALAEKARVSQQLISRLESGVDSTSKKLPDLARALGVSVIEIDESYRTGPDAAPIDNDEEILAFLKRIAGLGERGVELSMMTIQTARDASRTQKREQTDADDQSKPANRRRVSGASRQR